MDRNYRPAALPALSSWKARMKAIEAIEFANPFKTIKMISVKLME
jgi:hypothetical protein